MFVLGVTGRLCAGKSSVNRAFKNLGAVVLDADKIVADLLLDKKVQADIVPILGRDVFSEDEFKKAISDIIFRDRQKLDDYCNYIYPLVLSRLRSATPDLGVTVWEVPLLFEAGWQAYVDAVVLVKADFDVRLRRALGRGLSEDEFRRRDSLFWSDDKKEVDFIVENDKGFEKLIKQVEEIWKRVQGHVHEKQM